MNAKQKTIALLSTILLVTPLITYATAPPAYFEDPLGGMDIETFIKKVMLFFINLIGFIALLAIVYGGTMIVLGGMRGDSELKRGKEILFWAIIGLLIVGMARQILWIVNIALGL